MAGIVHQTEDETLFPEYIREGHMYRFDKAKNYYTTKWVDTLFFHEESRIFAFTFDEQNLESLNDSFKHAVYTHPFRYMLHRFLVLSRTFISSKHTAYAFISDDARTHSIHFFKKIFTKYNNLFPSILTARGISFLIILFYFVVFIRDSEDDNSREFIMLRNVFVIGLAYTFILMFTTMSSDYRYYYLVRLLSFFALPIYLNLRDKQKS